MSHTDVYIYYSGATDKTGKALQEALDITGGATAPKGKKRVIIGWGTKVKERISLAADLVLNHPNDILANRNKLSSLEVLKKAKVNVAEFVSAEDVMKKLASKTGFTFPLIGRTKFHQGGKGFWLCLDKLMVENAISEGAQYFQTRISIADEYRLHIFNGTLLYAQKKVKRDDHADAFKEQQAAKIANAAERGKKTVDKATMDFILDRLAKDQVEGSDMLIRSNERGWKFSQVKHENVPKPLLEQAVKALAATKLQFGAVDCCMDQDKQAWVIEINSAPGLDGTPFQAYVTALTDAITVKSTATKTTTKATKTAEVVAKGGAVKKTEKTLTLKEKLALLSEMADVADDDEAAALNSIAAKMFGG